MVRASCSTTRAFVRNKIVGKWQDLIEGCTLVILCTTGHSCLRRHCWSFTFPILLGAVLLSITAVCAFDELKEHHLLGCVIVATPYVYIDDRVRVGFSGVAITYLNLLQQNLQFRYDLIMWNDTGDALVDHIATCDREGIGEKRCLCNIGVGAFTMSNERVETVKFVWAFGDENYRMVTTKRQLEPENGGDTWFVFKTFSSEVWIVILCGIVLHSIGTVFFWPFRKRRDLRVRDMTNVSSAAHLCRRMHRFPAAVLFSYAHLIGYPIGNEDNRSPSFHRTAWLVLGLTSGLFLLTVYEASLTVLLFQSVTKSPFDSISDLSSCEISPAKIAFVKGSAASQYWNFAVNTTLNREKCNWGKAGVPVESVEEGFELLKRGTVGYFFDLGAIILFRAHRNCEVYQPVGDPFFSNSVGFIMPNDSNKYVHKQLSRQTRLLREADRYQSASLLASRNECEENVDATITLGKLGAFFSMYVVFWAILLTYRLVFLCRRRQETFDADDGDGKLSYALDDIQMSSRSRRELEFLPADTDV